MSMAYGADGDRYRPEEEVALDGVAAEFRTALRDEIDAARRASASSGTVLLNGRLLGQVGVSYQYAFTLESALQLPDGAPGDLVVPGRPPIEASVVSIDGLAVTVAVSASVGDFVPRASLQSNLTHLLRRLIERIERGAGEPNPIGDLVIGNGEVTGHPVDERVWGLNAPQALAVASALGRDLTYIWGPPGTGKTRTIGTIGEQLVRRGRSLLLVSHTNAAVDQALLHIADALGEGLVDGSVLRLGDPRDRRLRERDRLLAATHVKERSEELEAERREVEQRLGEATEEVKQALRDIALAEWVAAAEIDLSRWRRDLDLVAELKDAHTRGRREHDDLKTHGPRWQTVRGAAQTAQRAAERAQRAGDELVAVEREVDALSVERAEAEQQLVDAEGLLVQIDELTGLMRRWRRLPTADEQRIAVTAARTRRDELSRRHGQAGLALDRLRRDLDDGQRIVDAFRSEYHQEPAEALRDAHRFDASLRAAHERERAAGARHRDAAGALASQLDPAWAVMRDFEIVTGQPATLAERLDAMQTAHADARVRVASLDVAARRADVARLNAEIAELEQRAQEIAEALARVEEVVVGEATVIAATLTTGYLRDSVQRRRFDTVVLDEASMAPIPALWQVASLADRAAVAVGDFKQLPPIKHSTHPLAEQWLGRDVFDAAGVADAVRDRRPPEHLVALHIQYRMHSHISRIPNELIYDRLLENGSDDDDGELDGWYRRDWGHDAPVLLVDTADTHAWVTSVGGAGRPSRLNFLSATVCLDLTEQLLADGRPELPLGDQRRVLISAPYRPHARLLELLIRDHGLEREVVAGTAHTFQGSEAPVVIFDLVNDEPHWRVGMFNPAYDETTRRLLNVALTRARHRLIVVGDFDYIRRTAKRSFTGQLVAFLEDNYPKVSALDVVAGGLAARMAAAQVRVTGGLVEPPGERVVVTQENFFTLLSADLAAVRRRVVIFSPFLTSARVGWLEPQLRAATERGVRVYVVTKALEERGRDASSYQRLEATLRDWGVTVIHKLHMHEKLVFIDEGVLWSGSLNPLSHSSTQEVMERRASAAVVADYARTIRLDDLLALYDDGQGTCPICDSELVPAEGREEPFYWRCVQPDCHTRGISDPAPRDGVFACRNCGEPLAFGTWGEASVWRCTAPRSRHRQRIVRSHLKLPKMRALVPRAELRKLDRQFNIEPPPPPPPPGRNSAGAIQNPLFDGRATEATLADNGPCPLTARELDVLVLLADHLSRAQIAERLGLSPQTVKSYVHDLHRKLGTHDRGDAVDVARRHGWI